MPHQETIQPHPGAIAAGATMSHSLLTHGIRVHFAGVKALDGVDVELKQGEILGMIGPNGAGKTTLINVLSGFQRPTEGQVSLAGTDVSRWPAHRFPRSGLVRTFQRTHIFGDLSVFENVSVGAMAVGVPARQAQALTWEVLEKVGLAEKAHLDASTLTSGQERRLGLARALATRPRFLLLDEPAAGLNDVEGDELVETICALRRESGCGIMLVEHDMRLVMEVCDRIHVLNFGKTLKVGTPAEVRSDAAVVTAYLGSTVKHAGN